MFYFTNDQIDEIEKRLAVRAKKDTDFDAVSEAQEGDLVAIIHNGRNMICRLDKLPGRLVAKRYDEIPAEITEENILETPTAFSISVLKTLLGIEDMPEFDDDTPYTKDSYVSHVDDNGILRGYVFIHDKSAGYWDESVVNEISYASLSESIKNILAQFKSGGRVYVLENYFTDGKAKRALADEDGVNIKQYYAKKTDIPDINREIAEAIAVKLDNTPTGTHRLPIYVKYDPETGHGKSEVIDSLHVPGDIRSGSDIIAQGGVAALGIATLSTVSGGGGGVTSDMSVVLDSQTTVEAENGIIDLTEAISDGFEEYVPNRHYDRGDQFKFLGSNGYWTAYRVEAELGMTGGSTPDYGKCERITVQKLANPLNIGTGYINGLN